MKEYLCIWYDMESERLRETVEAENEEDARSRAYLNHSKPPAPQLTVIESGVI